MGAWRALRLAFLLGSLLVLLLIIVYWGDVGGFQELKHKSVQPAGCAQIPTGSLPLPASTDRTQAGPPVAVYATTPAASEDIPGAGQKQKEQEGETAGDREQKARKQRVVDVCSGKDSVDFPGRTRAFEQIPIRELDHLIVDDTHQIIYCYVPKVACTNWKRVMVVLSQSLISPSTGKPYTDPEAVPADLVHNSSLHLTFAKFWRRYGSLSRHLMALKLQHYTKFLFVRDPFVRLISAFRNKFGRPNEDFYRHFGSVMLRRYGNVSEGLAVMAAEAFAAGIKPTFHQFISYLLDPETEKENIFNEHWRQVYRLCHPCQVKYDFIGRLETLDTDSEHLLKLLNVDRLLRFPLGARNRTKASWEGEWFSQIPVSQRRELYKLYEPDFELFGYPKPDSVFHR
ncbi:carbohydrate sulfotransferase 12 [Kryptolebias marmoratus]|uniref:Carbohydrate sulfotransferase n=1 Tax=Kryptolebias marmoratus TaxID=37003 RepID=A0A3Q3AFC6_KRYMA|nr:carbohydrate sulfotransferase 12 [Kryptolebias marmoratus]XP_017261797.1 carbohydrate sulfotransferase 12 [Kryptolebias marmoratus]XP_037830671.1 carbohydrate sulfotransferase 12 [Kryptolebias marmoratus]